MTVISFDKCLQSCTYAPNEDQSISMALAPFAAVPPPPPAHPVLSTAGLLYVSIALPLQTFLTWNHRAGSLLSWASFI